MLEIPKSSTVNRMKNRKNEKKRKNEKTKKNKNKTSASTSVVVEEY
jgi:hypothetical protein